MMSAVHADALPRHKLTTDDFHRMADAGIFHEDDRVELIEGELIDMAPIGNRHASTVRRLIHAFQAVRPDQAVLDVQNPIQLSEHSEPEPDVVLLRPRADFYAEAMPTAADVLLLIEVSDSTVEDDRKIKIPLYARYGIGEVWLIDLTTATVERYNDPREGGYRFCERLTRNDSVSPVHLPQVQIALTEVL